MRDASIPKSIIGLLIFFLSGCAMVRGDQLQPPVPFVMGYANRLSCVAGETISFHLSSSSDSLSMRIERVGATNDTVFERVNIACGTHPIPDQASSHGCAWPAAFAMTIPADWKSGCYIASFTAKDQEARDTVLFVVRSAEPGKNTPILLQLATNTYNAYTNWGGHSLYAYHDRDGIAGPSSVV